jgi:predicted dehydrogenase
MTHTRILLIGFGPHAQRIYYPIAKKYGALHNFLILAAVDLLSKKNQILNFLDTESIKPELLFLDEKSIYSTNISKSSQNLLNALVKKHDINAVIIATDPVVHKQYALWALKNNLHILMDKPITAVPNSSTDIKAAKQIKDDYLDILDCYKKQQKNNPHIVFSLMSQRRYHKGFQKIKSLIKEVFLRTNCPITSIQSFHSDGQWRMPSEIIDIPYHSYNLGFGKFSHTGYHSMDILNWLIEEAESEEKKINNIEVFTNIIRPNDFFTQINSNDYKRIFTDYEKHKIYTDTELEIKTAQYGEIDAFSTLAFKHNNRTITLGSLNLVHNGFSQRGWISSTGRNLYKGNGRLRHETYFIEQGPFQAISLISYQSKEIDLKNHKLEYDIGGEFNFDIHVFRNNSLYSDWKNYNKYSLNELDNNKLDGYSRGHQEDARLTCFLEFINCTQNHTITCTSELRSHIRSVTLMSALYESCARKFNNLNPVVTAEY